jgi:hypothetical protein
LKVQHKQIRHSDPYYDRYQDGYGIEAGYQYPSGQFPPDDQPGYPGGRGRGVYSSLPPSGPSAGLYNRGLGDPSGVGVGGPSPVPSAGLNDPRSSPVGSNGAGGEYDGGAGPQPPPASSDPLGTMDSLRQTLPDVGGTTAPVSTSEN